MALCLSAGDAVSAPVRLTTHDLPPYSFVDERGKLAGVAIKRVECAMTRIQRAFTVTVYPWARAQKLVYAGDADGFFAASQSSERDAAAQMSAEIAPQEWRWYLLKETRLDPTSPAFRETATVGSFAGANMLDWLKANDYRVNAEPTTNAQLLSMLMARRVDAILANNLVMDKLLQDKSLQEGTRSVLQLSKPLGVYFSNAFLVKEGSDFLPRFNRAVVACGKP